MTLPLKHPFSAIVAGPSMAGKSQWIGRLIANAESMVSPPPEKIYICYKEWQPLYDTFKNVEFVQGMVDIDSLDKKVSKLIVFDDMMEKVNEEIAEVFTKFVHHRNLSAIFITQNIFHKSSHLRTMNLNSSYLVLFKNPRDANQIGCLARQMYSSGHAKFMLDAFKDATSVPYGYLFIDLKQDTYDLVRLRTGIFPDENTYIYMPKCSSSSLPRYSLTREDHEQKS